MSAVYGLHFTDLRHVAFSCRQRFQFLLIAPDKATKQSCDLSLCLYFIHCFIHKKVLNKISMLKEPQRAYCLAIANESIPDSLHNTH